MTKKILTKVSVDLKGVSFEMIRVESGLFWMGDDNGDSDEKPVHKVQLDEFAIGQYPVTQALWYEVMKERNEEMEYLNEPPWVKLANISALFKGANRPMEQVSWDQAILFCNRLSVLKQLPPSYDEKGDHLDEKGNLTNDITRVKGFRLPTEAEWEYAAIGGHLAKKESNCFIKKYEYAGSNRLEDVAWFGYNSNRETKDVGLKLENQLGLFDMNGNVWEWCWDWYDSDYYEMCKTNGIAINPLGGKGSYRVQRGGSWFDSPQRCHVPSRNFWSPDLRNGIIGFRLAVAFQSVG